HPGHRPLRDRLRPRPGRPGAAQAGAAVTTVRVHLDGPAGTTPVGTARIVHARGVDTTEFTYDDAWLAARAGTSRPATAATRPPSRSSSTWPASAGTRPATARSR